MQLEETVYVIKLGNVYIGSYSVYTEDIRRAVQFFTREEAVKYHTLQGYSESKIVELTITYKFWPGGN